MLYNTPNFVLNFVKNLRWFTVPEEDSEHFCPLHFGVRITKKNNIHQTQGGNSALQREEGVTSVPIVWVGPLWVAGPFFPPTYAGINLFTSLLAYASLTPFPGV